MLWPQTCIQHTSPCLADVDSSIAPKYGDASMRVEYLSGGPPHLKPFSSQTRVSVKSAASTSQQASRRLKVHKFDARLQRDC